MYTQCPDCRKVYALAENQLASGAETNLLCSQCQREFNILTLLSEKNPDVKPKDKKDSKKTKKKTKQKPNKNDQNKTAQTYNPSQPKLEPKPAALLAEAKSKVILKEEADSKFDPKMLVEQWQDFSANQTAASLDESEQANGSAAKHARQAVPKTAIPPDLLPWESGKSAHHHLWAWGVVLGVFVLIGQIIFFEFGNLSQNPSYRPLLETICRGVGCKLPMYKDLADFAVMQTAFSEQADNSISVRTIITNQSIFAQNLPSIEINLLDMNEQIFAQRRFLPLEYLPTANRQNQTIASNETIEVRLLLVKPETTLGGYTLNLVD